MRLHSHLLTPLRERPECSYEPIENPLRLEDVHAAIYKALGIPADTSYVVEARPFHVTKDGKGQLIDALLASAKRSMAAIGRNGCDRIPVPQRRGAGQSEA
jgi:hypothetical protein